MDLFNIVEKYIELSVKRDKLNSDIKDAKRNYDYAIGEGDIAFRASNLELEHKYNDTAQKNFELQNKLEKELLEVEELINSTDQAYKSAIESLDGHKLKDVALFVASKKDEVEERVNQLSQYLKVYKAKGDEAYAERNFEEEKKYNETCINYDKELQETQPLLHYYESFVSDLNMRASFKTGDSEEKSSLAK